MIQLGENQDKSGVRIYDLSRPNLWFSTVLEIRQARMENVPLCVSNVVEVDSTK